MTARQNESNRALRRRAEEKLNSGTTAPPAVLSLDEAQQLLHELRVYQIELEMQNEELRRTQMELDSARVRYFNLYDMAPVGYCTVSNEGVILEANLTAATLLGVTREAMVGQPLSRFILPDDQDIYYLQRKRLLKTAQPQSWEMRMLHAGGPSFWACLQATPGHDEECWVTLSDISERKRAEGEQEKLRAQLHQVQKMEAIGVLAGGIAHDFNNILSVILGYTEMAREDAGPNTQLGADLERILTSGHRAKDLVKQILAFSRQTTVNRIPLAIQPLVKESLKMLRASLPSTIAITERIDPQGRAVLADPTQVHQVVMNLCTNAFHAMEERGGVLTLAVHTTIIDVPTPLDGRQLPPGEYVELTVSDTGTGIGPDIIDRVFEPFFTTKEVGKGTGMGLSITHGIIKSYGGAITIDSTVGQGTTFHVYFPVIQEEATTADEAQAQEAPRGKGRVLFVDDEEFLAEMGREMLERLGYKVTVRNSSSEAFETFSNAPDQFDLVITDQTMPGMTGSDLSRRILQIRKDLPIILCTGFSCLIDEESAKAIGIKEFAYKPLTKESMGRLIRKVMSKD